MKTRIIFLIVILAFFQIETATAQQVLATSGGLASENSVVFKSVQLNSQSNQSEIVSLENGSSATFTVGQMLYRTFETANGSMAHGVQQAYEIFVIIGEEIKEITLSAKVYPNPTKDLLILEMQDLSQDEIRYRIMDMQGKVLKIENITSLLTEISMGQFTGASYFIQVFSNEKIIKSFQILKN